MNNFKITKTILENINEQNDRINECISIVNGYTTDEETRVNQELQRQENELRREEQYNNNENRFASINSQLETIANVSFENFKNDNINERLLNAINYCHLNNKKIISNKNTYTLNSPITFTNFTNFDGNGCTIITSEWLDEIEHAITFKNIQNVVIENVNFEISQNCHSWSCVGLLNCNNVKFVNCKFSSFSDVAKNTHGVLDVYRENTNIIFENCTFNQLSDSTAGGIWVRNGNNGVTDNVKFINCTFNKKGADEVLAIWGWQGTVKNIKVENCKFNVYKSTNNSDWIITLGQSGNCECIMENCDIYCEYSIVMFRCFGNSNAIVKNCRIKCLENTNTLGTLIQSDSSAYVEIADCDIDLNCPTGYISRYLDVFKNNRLKITSKAGFLNSSIVSNNIISGTVSSFMFQTCDNISNNNITINNSIGRVCENVKNFIRNKVKLVCDNVNGNTSFTNSTENTVVIKDNILDITTTTGNIKLFDLWETNSIYRLINNLININSGYYSTNNTINGTKINFYNVVNNVADNI